MLTDKLSCLVEQGVRTRQRYGMLDAMDAHRVTWVVQWSSKHRGRQHVPRPGTGDHALCGMAWLSRARPVDAHTTTVPRCRTCARLVSGHAGLLGRHDDATNQDEQRASILAYLNKES